VSFDASETAETGRIARRLGGYDEMLRLERDLARYQRDGIQVRMVLDDEGRRQLQPVDIDGTPTDPLPEAAPDGEPMAPPVRPRGLHALLRRLLPR
jgi:hypothetical protein